MNNMIHWDRELTASLLLLLGVQTLLAIAVALTGPGSLHLLAIVALVGTSIVGAAGLGCLLQRRVLGAPVETDDGELTRIAGWGGQYVAGTAGPLLSALLVVGAIVAASGLMPVSGAGVAAGFGALGLALPACLLVMGAAALKLPARALDVPLDTADVIALVRGREFSLLPVAGVMLVSAALLAAGTALAASGQLLAPLVLLPAVPILLVGAVMAARRYAELACIDPL